MGNILETYLDYRKQVFRRKNLIFGIFLWHIPFTTFFILGFHFLAEATCLLAILFKEASISAIASAETSGVAANGIWLHATVGAFVSAVCIPAYREKVF